MTSHSSTGKPNDDNGGNAKGRCKGVLARLIERAIRYASTTREDRDKVHELVQALDRIAAPGAHQDPAVPPQQFVNALRASTTTQRRPIVVTVDGQRIPVLLNPQGKTDPDREAWLWAYLRRSVQETGGRDE